MLCLQKRKNSMCSSKKKEYNSYRDAYNNLQKIREKNPFQHRGECRIYKCNMCGKYHLTKRPKILPPKVPLRNKQYARILTFS